MFKHIKYKDKEKERYLITLARSIKLFFISLFLKSMYEKRSSMISPWREAASLSQVLNKPKQLERLFIM